MRVVCPECGCPRETSNQIGRRIRAGLRSGLCGWCRDPNRVKPPHSPDSSQYHEFWRERFTQTEIDALWSAVSLYLDVAEVKAA